MNLLDLVLLLILAWGAIAGYRNGLFREVASLLGLVLGVFLAIIAADVTGRVAAGMVDWNVLPLKVLAFVVVFALIILILKALAGALTGLFKAVMLNFFNRLAGFFFGLLKASILISLVLFFLQLFNDRTELLPESVFQGSLLAGYLQPLAPAVFRGLALF
jgi:membrane protein required for colicin V production